MKSKSTENKDSSKGLDYNLILQRNRRQKNTKFFNTITTLYYCAMLSLFLHSSSYHCRSFSTLVMPTRRQYVQKRLLLTRQHQWDPYASASLSWQRVSSCHLMSTATTDTNTDNNSDNMKNDNSTRQQKEKQLKKATRLSLAPMMEYTDRHFRHVVRMISSNTLLYTEMVAANTLSYERANNIAKQKEQGGDGDDYDMSYLRRYLAQGMTDPLEGPSVLQLGGSDPTQMDLACRAVMDLTKNSYCDYTALNLNCGCPSPKVAGKGCFGAALMDDPILVKNVVEAMYEGSDQTMPITVKCRIGTDSGYTFTRNEYDAIDEQEEYSKLCNFIETVASSGIVTDFQIHARIAVLGKSFSPADNRKVPPLKYDFVRKLVNEYPEFTFSLNGGIGTLEDAKRELDDCPGLAGIMIGRAWTSDPWSFAMTDEIIYGEDESSSTLMKPRNRLELLQEYGKHADSEEETYDPLKIRRFITKAVCGFFF
mmetsp:Transcript_1949/g.3102  ORF Transcript_1949/g.3102 Transcript_1949/m.3102 type:complete len:480 (-) Transcript_1949:10-1449(-)